VTEKESYRRGITIGKILDGWDRRLRDLDWGKCQEQKEEGDRDLVIDELRRPIYKGTGGTGLRKICDSRGTIIHKITKSGTEGRRFEGRGQA